MKVPTSQPTEVPVRRAPGVHRLLVSGTDSRLQLFYLRAHQVHFITSRGNTTLCTVFDEHLEAVMATARLMGVTVQQRAEQAPWWPVVVQGRAEAWREP